jgi:hypothetical protein
LANLQTLSLSVVGFLCRLGMEDSAELLYYAVRIPPEVDLHDLAINHPVDGYPFESQFPTWCENPVR